MPLYGSSSRSKKSKKDGSSKSSTASVFSATSRSTKASRASGDRPQVASQDPSLVSKNTAPSPANVSRTHTSGKSAEPERTVPNVFEYLDEDESTSEEDSSEDDDFRSRRVSYPSSSSAQSKTAYVGLGRQSTLAALGADTRSRTSSTMSKDSIDSQPLPTAFDIASGVPSLHKMKSKTSSQNKKPNNIPAGISAGSSSPEKRSLELSPRPDAFYSHHSASQHRPPLPPSPPRSPEEDSQRGNHKRSRSTKTSPPPSGYGLLAWRLSSSTDNQEPRLPPLYRRFEDLNHRVLLHLQDEIAQMEEDLRVLDEYDQMHRAATAEQEGTTVLPASRRMDVQAQVYSSLHYRKEELLGALAQKTEQYNNALSAYSRVLQNLPPAENKDIETYRTWMNERNPIIAAETRFLDHTKDLVSLAPRAISASRARSVYAAIIIASAAVVLPLLTFSMIAEFSGRLLVVAVVGGAAAAVASTQSTGADQLVGSQDGWRSASLYFGFMATAALFIP
ncbi:hypothetical protein ASPACDRAFT_56541 [Aspergillus aculeatus ATCC 16872]|uniref:DUF6594 domain-containing protein n=1 Tax=Aspergillus aculeatus (strain ATCC 16872 / CBS 172.66 / WB 5094) TaxID=690307 RepID=A0A1L9X9X1_ASPA1|nr:uncharacterized protein ASPACDRAFT_56541 [Aspergillus aculeatus ATCC 16872]OJK05148.1 hypothetical protein ASPACDRAFT_56541 [Aspergillus aculeatus ATCC 16872]